MKIAASLKLLSFRTYLLFFSGFGFAATVLGADTPQAPTLEVATPAEISAAALQREGTEQVKRWIGAIAHGDIKECSAMMSESFQSLHSDGARNKEQELELIAGLDMPGSPVISQIKATGSGDNLVVTYRLVVTETIEGQVHTSHVPRMTVFEKREGKFLVVAHVNMVVLGEPAS